jgi:hypothetical protein
MKEKREKIREEVSIKEAIKNEGNELLKELEK